MSTRSAVQHNDHGESRYVLNGNTFWVRLLDAQRYLGLIVDEGRFVVARSAA
jgi:hypothetical protein